MESLKSESVSSLLHELIRQFPSGETTWNRCRICGEPARGCGECRKCICLALSTKGVSCGLLGQFCAVRKRMAEDAEKSSKLYAKIINTPSEISEPSSRFCCGGIVVQEGENCPICGDKE